MVNPFDLPPLPSPSGEVKQLIQFYEQQLKATQRHLDRLREKQEKEKGR